MGAVGALLEAQTMEELEKKVTAWIKENTGNGILVEQAGWNPKRVHEEDGMYKIYVRVRT